MSYDYTYIRRHVTRRHLELLTEYMEQNVSLALASARSREDQEQSKRMWEEFAVALNRVDSRVTKTGRSWSRYWIDWKFKIRCKYAIIKKSQSEGKPCRMQLSPLEERIVKILTDEKGNLLPTASVYHQTRLPMYAYIATHDTHEKEDCNAKNKCEIDIEERDTTTPDVEFILGDIDIPEHGPECSNQDLHHFNPCKIEESIEIPVVKNENKKSIEELRRELVEFELKKQKELFEIEKRHRIEKHNIEMALLELKKQMLLKELNKL